MIVVSRRWTLTALALALASVALARPAPAPAAGTATALTVLVRADAYASGSKPFGRFGRAPVLKVGRSPRAWAFLSFDVPALRAGVTRATLLVLSRRAGGEVQARAVRARRVSERTLSARTAPRLGRPAGEARPGAAGTWTAIDVTRLVRRRGLVSVALVGAGGAPVHFASREAGRRAAPRLVVESGRRSPPVVAAAGNIACDPAQPDFNGGAGTDQTCRARATADVLTSIAPDAVLMLGDGQYWCGGYQAWQQSYDPTWGRLKAITFPVLGNHDPVREGGTDCDPSGRAGGYFRYFGARAGSPDRGYYSFDLGAWHIVALNSLCQSVACGAGSPQERWLRADLAAHPQACTLAIYHHPRFSSSYDKDAAKLDALWRALVAGGADVVLNAHDHVYERFAPQDAAGDADAAGVRQFTVGTGGYSHHPFFSVARNSQVRDNQTFGVLRLQLLAGGYRWRFLPIAGELFSDSGSQRCR